MYVLPAELVNQVNQGVGPRRIDETYHLAVDQDLADANALNVTMTPEFFVNGLAPVERKNESESGWAAMAEYRLADEGICTLLPNDLDFRYAIAGECSVGMAHCAEEFMDVKAGDRLLLVGNGQRQFSFSHVITGLYRGARVISAVQDDFQAEIVGKIGEARGGTPDLHIVDMRYPDWKDKVFDLTDGVGPDKIADFTSVEEILNAELDLVRHDGVLYIQENLRNTNRVLKVDPYAHIAEKNLIPAADRVGRSPEFSGSHRP